MEKQTIFTREDYEKLSAQLNKLKTECRDDIAEKFKEARSHGDLSENADYDAARDHQAKVEARIKELEHQIKNAEVITETKKTNFVRIGSTVEIQELDTKNKLTYKIVGSVEADPLNGLLSNVTPLAEAILDQRVNDVVTVKVDPPYDVKILKIN